MTTKPILLIDADMINDLFGRSSFDATAGAQALDELYLRYDIRITSTVLAEVNQAPPYNAMANWFTSNNVHIYDTSAFKTVTSDKRERSIASVIDQNYSDPDVSVSYYSADVDYQNTNVEIGSRDADFFGIGQSGDAYNSNQKTTHFRIDPSSNPL